jgi:hypothetical protein
MSIGPPKWDRTKNEMEVARVSPGTKYSDLVVGIYVIIYDIETIERRSVQDVMKSFFYTVRDIVTALETESKKLGLVST